MRIGYLYGFRAYPPRGGNHTHVYQLVTRFLAAGHSVATIGEPDVPGSHGYPGTRLGIGQFLDSIEILYVRVDGNPLIRDAAKQACILKARMPIVWEINAPANEALAFSWLGRKAVRQGRISLIVDRIRRWAHAERQMPAIMFEEWRRRRLAKKVSVAVCVSQALCRYAKEYLGINNVETIPNGGDVTQCLAAQNEVTPLTREQRFKVLYCGSPIYPWQGFDIVGRVARLGEKELQNVAFVFLVNQLSEEVPNGRNVLLFEGVPYDRVCGFIKDADLCLAIHPDYGWSKWGFHNSPIKVFEYMSCGKPVLATRVGQLEQVIDDGKDGFLVDYDVNAVIRKLAQIVDKRESLPEIGRLARKKVEETYNWDRVAGRTLKVFEHLLPGTR
jgi:glycosyltransferase involved in cell wall biosynthesis